MSNCVAIWVSSTSSFVKNNLYKATPNLWKDNEWTGQSLSSLLRNVDVRHSRYVCRSTSTTLGVTGIELVKTYTKAFQQYRLISSPNVRSFYCQPSSVPSYHGSAMDVVMIRCRRSNNKEQWVVGVAEEDLVNYRDNQSNTVIAAHLG